MRIRIRGGKDVQIISINWFSKILILIFLFNIKNIIIYEIKKIIIIIIKIVWSWKKINCSISGEFLFWKFILNHVIISKKRFFFINEF